MELVPENKHSAVMERMEQATRDCFRSIGLGEAYEQMEAWGSVDR